MMKYRNVTMLEFFIGEYNKQKPVAVYFKLNRLLYFIRAVWITHSDQ